MSSYSRAVAEIAKNADPAKAPCSRCKTPTQLVTLGQYGARCRPCFDDYCAEGMGGGPGGYATGAGDTSAQAAMRKRLKAHRPTGQAMAKSEDEVDAQKREEAKREQARKVAEYGARAHAFSPESQR